MKCPNCGAELPDNAVFCGKCGLSLGDLKENTVNTSVNETSDSSDVNVENSVSNIQESVSDESTDVSDDAVAEVEKTFDTEASGKESSNSDGNEQNGKNEVRVEKIRPEGYKSCPNCGAMLPEDAVFCGKCGSGLSGNNNADNNVQSSGDSVCPNCGTPRKDGTGMFCPKCGYKYTNTIDTGFNAKKKTKETGMKSDNTKKSPKRFIPLIACLVVFWGVAVIFAYNFFFSPQVRFINMQAELINKTYIDPLNTLAKPFTKDFSSDITFSGNSENFGQVFKNTSAVLKTDLKKDQITLNGLINYDDETVFDVYCHVDKEAVSVSFPSLNDDYYYADLKKLKSNLDLDVDLDSLSPNVLNDISDTKKYSSILTRYGKLFLKQINSKNLTVKESRKIDFDNTGLYCLNNDLKGRYTEYIFNPSEKDIKSFLKDVGESMKKDEELKELYEAIYLASIASDNIDNYKYGYSYSLSGAVDYDDFVDNFMDSIDDLVFELDDMEWIVYAEGNKAKFISVNSGSRSVIAIGAFDDKDEHHNAIAIDSRLIFENYYEKSKDGTFSGYINQNSIKYEDVNLKKQSPFGIYYGKYTMGDSVLSVDDGDRGTDHIIRGKIPSSGKYKFVINATNGSSVKKPSGNKVDVSDYDAKEFNELSEDIGQDMKDYLSDNKDVAELFNDLDRYF